MSGDLGRFGGRVEHFVELPSTNTYLRDGVTMDPQAWPDRSVVLTRWQTAGKGRDGRDWQTRPGTSLTMSVLVKTAPHGFLPLLAGLAVHDALATFGLAPAVKWPNDVLIPAATVEPGWGRYRKVAGVLCEALADAVVVGIGVNVSQTDLPVPHATSLALAGVQVLVADLADRVLTALDAVLAEYEANPRRVAARVADASVTLGAAVSVLVGGRELSGVARHINDDGSLAVQVGTTTHTVVAGDVSIRM